jgi:hypothetical protein
MIGAINAFFSLMCFFVFGAWVIRWMIKNPPRYEREHDSE